METGRSCWEGLREQKYWQLLAHLQKLTVSWSLSSCGNSCVHFASEMLRKFSHMHCMGMFWVWQTGCPVLLLKWASWLSVVEGTQLLQLVQGQDLVLLGQLNRDMNRETLCQFITYSISLPISHFYLVKYILRNFLPGSTRIGPRFYWGLKLSRFKRGDLNRLPRSSRVSDISFMVSCSSKLTVVLVCAPNYRDKSKGISNGLHIVIRFYEQGIMKIFDITL